ncbi:hypothetical protein SSX86_007161 [Deinandra increscens subsp. villosa]|uniref:RanBP2-type domain-containing protein n=1 Tax=Deinandra increscens subsp. villosa TaxID=3103831 RepID=A0AAP0H4G8_9ASTR
MLKHISETLKSFPKPPKSKSAITISPLHTRNKTLISNPAIDFILDEFPDLQSPNRCNNPTQIASKPAEPAESVASTASWIETYRRLRATGCPSIDRKVVNSGKRLRAHLGIDEGNVCSSCNLRGNCERAYLKAHGDEGGHTVDVMRLVLTYGLDHNKPFINKRLEEAVRSLTKDMVKFGKNTLDIDHPSKRVPSVPRSPAQQQEHRSTSPPIHGGWNCSKCKFLNFARNIKCLQCNNTIDERLPRSRNNRNDVPLKGDWLCIRCNFFNFAKNTRCLQCHTNPPQRQLNSGEWECDSCNYINFKRNTACLKCDHKRPKALNHSTLLLTGSTKMNFEG